MPFRKVVFWVHLACGLAAGTVILVMSITGVLLTYQKQMTEWADRAYWVAPALEDRHAPISEVVANAAAYDPAASVSSVVLYSDPDAPVGASLGRGRTLYLDPSTAEVRGENTPRMRAFFSVVVGWHRWFNVSGDGRATARAVTGWSNVVFLFLVVSGLYLWFPSRWRWQHLKARMVFNRKAKGKARDFNWHHVFGFWLSIPLAMVVASATVISFPSVSDLAYRVMGDTPPRRRAATPAAPTDSARPGPALLDEGTPEPVDISRLNPIVETAMGRVSDWRTMTVTVPSEAGTPVQIRIDQGWGGAPQKRHTLTYDVATGLETSHTAFEDQSAGQRLRSYLRFTHTGEYYGLWGQTLAGLASLAGVFLVWSGFALAWRRLVRPLRRNG
jgi:uncharacterized iron-regulated membrane protein